MDKGPSQSDTGTGTRRWEESFKEIPLERETIQESFTKTTYHTVFTLLLLMDLQSFNIDQHRENTRLSRKVEICRLNFWPAPFLTKQEQELAELSRCPQKSIPSNTSICTTQKSIDIQI